MGIEKRRYKRVDLKFMIEYRGKDVWQNAQALNISQGGLFIVTDKVEPQGTRIDVMFDFGVKRRRHIQAKAIVSWVRQHPQDTIAGVSLPKGMGIRFLELFPQDAAKFIADAINEIE